MGFPRYPRKVVSKTMDYTVLAADNGTLFDTTGSTGNVNFTLPTLAAGFLFGFFNAVDFNMTVTAADETLVAFNDTTADSIAWSTMSEKTGAGFLVWSNAAGTKWHVNPLFGSEAQTVTIGSA